MTGPFAVGVTGEQVKLLQQMLTLGNYYSGVPSRVYDNDTILAVQSFQRANAIVTSGLPTTTGYGLAGPSTRLALNRLYAGKPFTITTVTPANALGLPNLTDYQNLTPAQKKRFLII